MQPTRRLEKYSVQEFEPKDSLGFSTIWSWDYNTQPGVILPEWGLHSRDRVLRDLYRNHYNWIGQAAVAALIRKIKQVPYTIQAGRNLASYYQEVFNRAQFNRGWGEFLSRFLLDFLTCDYGGYWELVGKGKADSPIRGRVMGISALDSLRCVPTGNNEYPVIYYSKRTGQMHRLHESRVVRIVDMPDGDESRHLAGLCAMSRAAAMIEQQIPLQQYVSGSMDDKPPIGIFYNNANMTDDQWKVAVTDWKQQRDRGQTGIIAIQGTSEKQNSGQFLRFADAPEGFDYNVYTEIAVNAFAAAFGIDRQDIWPLTGKMAGTATQSEVLFEKSRGMAFGDILSTIERALNNVVLPKDVEFNFEYKDEEKDKQVAERDTIILNNALSLVDMGIPKENIVRYLANNSEQFSDILTDASGEIIELPDDDMKPDPVPPQLVQTQAPQLPEGQQPEQVQVDDNTDETDEEAVQQTDKAYKELADTRSDFMTRFDAFLEDLRAGNLNRRRAGIILRGMLNTYGNRAFDDGLDDGGVDISERSGDDERTITRILKEQSPYVSEFTNQIVNGSGITDEQARQKAEMWFNKSVDPFYQAGKLSADANGMYQWRLGNTEHCSDCKDLAGQVHRLKVYMDTGWYPRSSNLECGGFHCQCSLVKSRQSATGRLPRSANPRG